MCIAGGNVPCRHQLKSQKKFKGDDDTEYWKRINNCRKNGGHPVPIQHVDEDLSKKAPGRCWVCGNDCFQICIKCHRFFCNTRITEKKNNKRKDDKKARVFQIESFKTREGEDTQFWKVYETCYEKEHMCMPVARRLNI